ncbi:MAG: hypothetical protein K8R59_15575 [Thermoanaerobaculales bacterium]|nr:hypothetical protein [Thermoanaerobaculales bacterium]
MFEQDFVNLISRLARYSGEDEATGLRNLRQFLHDTERELARSRRTGENLRILVVEPDSGISLAEVVRVVQECLSHEDLFARIGSRCLGLLVAEEFEVSPVDLIYSRLESLTPFSMGERRIAHPDFLTISAQTLLQNALQVLETAKAEGGNRHIVWQSDRMAVH